MSAAARLELAKLCQAAENKLVGVAMRDFRSSCLIVRQESSSVIDIDCRTMTVENQANDR